jgi:hypothetical protein
MPSSYAGVTFKALTPNNNRVVPEEQEVVVVTHIPLSNRDNVQWGGLTNPTVEVDAMLDTMADLDTLRAARGMTGRPLTLDGQIYNAYRLLNVLNATPIGDTGLVFCRLRFIGPGVGE